VKNISNANSRFPILYSTKLPPEGEASVPELQVDYHGGNPFRYDEAKLRVLRMLHQLLNFVSIADYYLSLVINTRFCFSVPFYFSGLYLCLYSAFSIKFLFSLLSGKMAASSFFNKFRS